MSRRKTDINTALAVVRIIQEMESRRQPDDGASTSSASAAQTPPTFLTLPLSSSQEQPTASGK